MAKFPLAEDHFSGGRNLIPGHGAVGVDLASLLNSMQVMNPDLLIVDGSVSTDPDDQDGSLALPFGTIQQMIDVAVANRGTTSATVRKVNTGLIFPGEYDEDLNIDLTRLRLALLGLGGAWHLGTWNESLWQESAPRRNITITGDSDQNIDNIRMLLSIGAVSFDGDIAGNLFQGYAYRPRISGQIISTMIGTNNWTLDVSGTVFGTDGESTGVSIDCTGDAGSASVLLSTIGCDIKGKIQIGTDGRYTESRRCDLDGDVAAAFIADHVDCNINGDWTIIDGITGEGFVDCEFDAMTFDGPAGSFIVDSVSHQSSLAAPVTLAGGATRVFRGVAPVLVFSGGAAAASAGEHLEANVGVGGTAATLGVSTQTPSPTAGVATKLTWNKTDAGVDTVLKVLVAGSVVDTVTLTDGAAGSIALPLQAAVAEGDLIAVEYDAGTAPGAMTAQVFVQ